MTHIFMAGPLIVKVLFFAKARELLDKESDNLFVEEKNYSGLELITVLEEKYPALLNLNRSFILALNEEYLEMDQSVTLTANDELAVIPPISGG